jgi:hypothetical protein
LLDSVWRGSLGRMLPRGSRFRAGSAQVKNIADRPDRVRSEFANKTNRASDQARKKSYSSRIHSIVVDCGRLLQAPTDS